MCQAQDKCFHNNSVSFANRTLVTANKSHIV